MSIHGNLLVLPESSIEAMKDLDHGVQPESSYMVPSWAVEPEPDALGEHPPMRLTSAGKAWLAERVARMSNAADARVNALDLRVREVFTEPITAEEGVERLVRERDELRKRVADFERLLTEPKVEQAYLLTRRDGAGRLTRKEILSAFTEVLDEALVANLHRRLNKGVAGALGLLEMQKDPETGESYLPSWHDLPERVAALVQERDALKAEMADLLKPAVDIDLRGALANVRALRALLGIPAAERTTGERADIEALYANMTEAMGMVLSEIPRLRAALRLADEQSAEAIKRVSSEIVADKWNSTAEFQAEVERLRNDLRRVDHALQGRIKPGDTLERTIANLIADLDRASADVERLTTQVKDAETRADNAYAEGLSYGQTAAEGECDADHEAQPDPEKVAALKAEVERLTAELEEARLTWLA